MNKAISRKEFLRSSLITAAGLIITPNMLAAGVQDKPPAISPEIVSQFVRVAHFDFDKLKQMLQEHPLLLNSAWDWGGGDFETAMNAAGHMGLKETAEYLLTKGARADIFALTMLGKTEIVKRILKDYPVLLNSLGPHGFTLLHHAEQGGKDSEELLKYLQDLGLKEKKVSLF